MSEMEEEIEEGESLKESSRLSKKFEKSSSKLSLKNQKQGKITNDFLGLIHFLETKSAQRISQEFDSVSKLKKSRQNMKGSGTPSINSRVSGQDEGSAGSKFTDQLAIKKYTKEEIVNLAKSFLYCKFRQL